MSLANIADKFWNRVDRSGTGCWEWNGPTAKKGGHGLTRDENGRRTVAHRIAYRLERGDIPAGLVLSHSCDNPRCCRPDHLRAVSQKENMREMISRGRGVFQKKYGKREHPWRSRSRKGPPVLGIPISLLVPVNAGPIINVCGPPGSGKSYAIDRLVASGRLPGFRVFKIDDYRHRHHENSDSWAALTHDVACCHEGAIVESSGLSISLDGLRLIAAKQGRGFRTIIFTAPRGVCLERVRDRINNRLPDIKFTIIEMVDACIEKLPAKWPGATTARGEDGAEILFTVCRGRSDQNVREPDRELRPNDERV